MIAKLKNIESLIYTLTHDGIIHVELVQELTHEV